MQEFRNRIILIGALAALALWFPSPSNAATAPFPVALSGQTTPSGGTYGYFSGIAINNSGQVAFESAPNNGASAQSVFAGAPGAIHTVALTGTAAPGGGNFGTFSQAFLNDSGQVAFMSTLNGGSSNSGIFTGNPGSLQPVALQNTPAPAGGTYSSFATFAFNNSAQLAFHANLTAGSSTDGIFTDAPGSVQTVALQGSAAPAGGNYGSDPSSIPSSNHPDAFFNLSMNAAGTIAFDANLIGGTSINGIFTGTPGSLSAVALSGTPAPNGGNYTGDLDDHPRINASGQIAFFASVTGSSSQALIVATHGSAQVLAANSGSSIPPNSIFASFSYPSINAAGTIAFNANLQGNYQGSIFVGTPGSLKQVAAYGDPAPFIPGYTLGGLDPLPTINSSGEIAFAANLIANGSQYSTQGALYAGSPGNINLIVRTGQVIDVNPGPGIDNRTVYSFSLLSGFGGQDGAPRSFNDSDELVYLLSFTDGSDGVFTSFVPEPTSQFLLLTLMAICSLRRNRAESRTSPLP